MLRADLIDLLILSSLVDWSDVSGRFLSLTTFQSLLAPEVGFASDGEVIDALLLLIEGDFIASDQFTNPQYVQYTNQGSAYFYKANLRFKARPLARRHLQELKGRNRSGIFLSHIAEEKAAALRLRTLLKETLSADLPVFVSSDYESIQSGDPWYQKILEGLGKVEGVISLLSPASLGRPWINFEAGVGVGREAKVMPVVWRGLEKGDVRFPLGHQQIRALQDEEDLKGLLRDIAALCHRPFKEGPISQFLKELPGIEASISPHGLTATLFREGRRIRMLIQNNSSRPLELVEAELLVPDSIAGANFTHEYQPVLIKRYAMRESARYVGHCLTVHPSPVLYLGVNPLKPILGPNDIYVPDYPGFTLPEPLSAQQESLSICYTVASRLQVFGPTTTLIKDIPIHAEASQS